MKKTLLTFFIACISLPAFSQQYVTEATASNKAVKLLNDGVNAAMTQQLSLAIIAWNKAIAEEPNFITAWHYLGDAYKNSKNDSMAIVAYSKVIELNPEYDASIYFKLSELEAAGGMYDEAYDHINIFLMDPAVRGGARADAEKKKMNYEFAKEAVQHPVDFNPVPVDEFINSDDPEYFPSLSVDGSIMVFTRRIKDVMTIYGNREAIEQEDFYISYFEDGHWTLARNMGKPVNTELNEGAQNISADGRLLFYTMCDNVENGFGSCDLYYSIRIGKEWSYPENCGRIINSADWDSQPSVSGDGKYLFFSSSRPGGQGSYDLWMATMGDDGYWESPVNLGATINTPGSEQCPFIHPDGKTLYFSSDGHPGMGSSDLFYSRMDEYGNWSEPVNLGYPINTNTKEISLMVSADGKTAFYSSDRGHKVGQFDIYTFQLPEESSAEPVSYVKAIVTDEMSGLPIEAKIQLVDITDGDIISNSTSDAQNGQFLVVLPLGGEYGLFVQKEGYLFHSENFSLKNALPDQPYVINVKLQPVQAGEVLTLKNIFFESGSAALLGSSQTELHKLLELMQKNPTMTIQVSGHTDNVGAETDNQKLSLARALSVKNFLIQNGISESRITYKGFGESKPIDTNDTESGKANNRRTEIVIVSL